MTLTPDLPPSHHHAKGQGWMVLTVGGQSMAVSGAVIEGVHRTSEAVLTSLESPPAKVEIHRGRPWFIVPFERVLQTLEALNRGARPDEWTVTLCQPSGVGIHVDAIEGPYRGAVMDGTLRTSHGAWPIAQPL